MIKFLLFISISVSVFAQEINFDKDYFFNGQAVHNSLKKFSEVQYPGDQTIDIKYYKLDLNITYSPNYLTGAVTIKFKPALSSINQVFFDLQNNLLIDSILINENYQPVYSHSSNKINITLDRNYNANEELSAVIYYKGVPGSSGFGSFEFSTHNSGTQPAIWTLSEPYGASDWWACKDTPADKADSSDVWCTVATGLTVVSNGALIDVIDNGNNTATYRWKNSYPIAQYLISLAIANYHLYTNYFKYSPTDSMPVTHYIYPEYFNSQVQAQLDQTIMMLQIFSDRFGLYPFIREKYGHVQFGWGGGMEHQTIASMGSFGSGLVSHELSHQWFGDMITCRDWQNIWLNEGFATYCEGVYIEDYLGKPQYLSFITNEMIYARQAVGSVYVQDISSVGSIFNSNRSYSKGGVILHMLRGVLGDSLFFNTMKTYANHPDYKYGTAVTENFQSVAENLSGLDLEYFFNEWIYGENYPVYTVTWGYSKAGKSSFNIDVNIKQRVNSNPAFFTMPVEIKVTTLAGDTTVTLMNNQQEQNYSFNVKSQPIELQFDPNNWILKTVSVLSNVEDEVIPNNYSLKQNYPNPFNPATLIRYNIPLQTKVKLVVYDILGRIVKTLVNEVKDQGRHEISWDGTNSMNIGVSTGVYFYRLETEKFLSSKKMLLVK